MSPAVQPSAAANAAQPDRLSDHEMIVDLFAGGGGASTAIHMATGRHPDVAVNHSPDAVALHAMNHPTTRHYCCDVFEVDPLEACADRHGNVRPVGLLWASPDCTHHSKARGGKPAEKKIRALAWVVVKWVSALRRATGRGPRCIFLENVEEFQDWGPLGADNRPIKERRGETFRLWVSQLETLGYQVEWRELVAADYGAPTTRKRLFLIARNDGRAIRWPEATHAPRKKLANPDLFSKVLAPWRPAADIIDWTLETPSIFGRKKALAPKTQKRIAKGVQRFVIESPRPFIVPVTHGGERATPSTADPLNTVTCANRGEFSLAVPMLTPRYGERPGLYRCDPCDETFEDRHASGCQTLAPAECPQCGDEDNIRLVRPPQDPRALDIAQPYPTVVPGANGGDLTAAHLMRFMGDSAGRDFCEPSPTVTANSFVKRPGGASPIGLCEVVLSGAVVGCGGRAGQSPARGIEDPVGTVTAKADRCLASTCLTPFVLGTDNHSSRASRVFDMDEPLRTVTSAGGQGLTAVAMAPLLIGSAYGDDRPGAGLRAWSACDPARTVTSSGQGGFNLAAAMITKFSENSIGTDPAEPLHTAMAGAPRHGLVTAWLGRQFGTSVSGRDMAEPHPTVVTGGGGAKSQALTAHLSRQFGRSVGSDASEPVGAIVAGGGGKTQVVAPVIDKYYATGVAASVEAPLDTATAKSRFGLSAAFLEQANTGVVGHEAEEPVSTILAAGCHQRPVEVQLETLEGAPGSRRRQVVEFLQAHFGEPTEAERADPLATARGRLLFGLVIIDGQAWQISDIGMRMLTPRELYGAQGFPADYVIDHTADGPLTKTAQTRMAGNSVSPPPAAAMIAANDPLLSRERAVA